MSTEAESYEARPFGTAFGVFRKDAIDDDAPLITIYDQEAAYDLATLLNWAAVDRERHRLMPSRKKS